MIKIFIKYDYLLNETQQFIMSKKWAGIVYISDLTVRSRKLKKYMNHSIPKVIQNLGI